MKKFFLLLFVSAGLALFSCSNQMNTYLQYNQKNAPELPNDDSNNDSNTGPEIAGDIKIPANFKYILPNGQIDPSYEGDAVALQALFSSDFASFPTANYDTKLYTILEIDAETNVPDICFVDDSRQWIEKNAGNSEYYYNGDTFNAMSFPVSEVIHYQYKGKNPFFKPVQPYNTVQFQKTDGTTETVMQRFRFFRWEGKALGAINLMNYMIAVDTYTGLLFAFAKIDELNMLGAPTKFVSVETYSPSRNFYEYDPCGYVDSSGKTHFYEWYMQETANPKDQIGILPPISGKSPYYNNGNTIDSIIIEKGGYPVAGTLTVTAKYLQNISVGGTFDSETMLFPADDAEFTYKIGVLRDFGYETDEYNTTILETGTSVPIYKSQKKEGFTQSATFLFENATDKLAVKFDNQIEERSNAEPVVISQFGKNEGFPLTFDRATGRWTDINGTSIASGEEKEVIVTYTVFEGEIKVCYSVKWENSLVTTNKGKLLTPSLTYTGSDSQLKFSGGFTNYTLEYTDSNIDSAEQEKKLTFDLVLHNLSPKYHVTVTADSSAARGFIKDIILDETSSIQKRGGIYGTQPITVSCILTSNPQIKLEGNLNLKLICQQPGYDTSYSPGDVVVNVQRKLPQITE